MGGLTVSKPVDRAGIAIGLQQCPLTQGDDIDSVDIKRMEKMFILLA